MREVRQRLKLRVPVGDLRLLLRLDVRRQPLEDAILELRRGLLLALRVQLRVVGVAIGAVVLSPPLVELADELVRQPRLIGERPPASGGRVRLGP